MTSSCSSLSSEQCITFYSQQILTPLLQKMCQVSIVLMLLVGHLVHQLQQFNNSGYGSRLCFFISHLHMSAQYYFQILVLQLSQLMLHRCIAMAFPFVRLSLSHAGGVTKQIKLFTRSSLSDSIIILVFGTARLLWKFGQNHLDRGHQIRLAWKRF